MRDRPGIATEPELLALDEPLSSLDVATQVQIVELLGELRRDVGMAYLFISHDLNLVRSLSHRVAVMYLGRVVEEGPVDTLYSAPLHPYTQALLSASPRIDPATRRQRIILEGDIPFPSIRRVDAGSGPGIATSWTSAQPRNRRRRPSTVRPCGATS